MESSSWLGYDPASPVPLLLRQPSTSRLLLVQVSLVLLLVADDLLSPHLAGLAGFPSPDLVAAALALAIATTALAPALGQALRLGGSVPGLRRAARLGVVLGAFFAGALVAAEYATRWIYRDVTTTADDRGYFTRRWIRQDPTPHNAYGFRDREFPSAKPAGHFRVAIVGDSFAYGNGLRVEERFSNLLQAALPAGTEILNFSVPGHNTPDHAATIRRHGVSLGVDFVLIQWFVNDVEGSDVSGRPTYRPLLPFPALAAWLYDASALFTVASLEWTAWQASRPGRAYADYMSARFGDPHGPGALQDAQAMEDLVTACRAGNLGLGFVLFPDTGSELGETYPYAFLHARVMDFCAARGLTCLDLRPDFAAVKDRRSLWVNRLDHHPSALANRIAAARIIEVFAPLWMASRRHS